MLHIKLPSNDIAVRVDRLWRTDDHHLIWSVPEYGGKRMEIRKCTCLQITIQIASSSSSQSSTKYSDTANQVLTKSDTANQVPSIQGGDWGKVRIVNPSVLPDQERIPANTADELESVKRPASNIVSVRK